MCGRFALKAPPRSIRSHFSLSEEVVLEPRYNIAPSQEVAAIRRLPGNRSRQLDMLLWGLIPGWAQDKKIGYRMINARAETLTEKPSFRAAFKNRRCLVAADGFYEWRHSGKTKQPYFIRLQNGAVFGFAGLWESWRNPAGGTVESCTIITTGPNELVKKIHDRMPVILSVEDYDAWLEQATREEELQQLLVPFPAGKMEAWRVNPMVNSPKNDTPECIEPLSLPCNW